MNSFQKVLKESPLVSLRQLMVCCVIFDGQASLSGVPKDNLSSLLLNNEFNLGDYSAMWRRVLIGVSFEEALGQAETCSLKFAVFGLLQLVLVSLALSTVGIFNVATKRG